MRRLAAGLDAAPDGFDLRLAETARSLGLGSAEDASPLTTGPVTHAGAASSSWLRSAAAMASPVRRKLPPLNRHQVTRLGDLQDATVAGRGRAPHAGSDAAPDPGPPARAQPVGVGEDAEAAERQLHRWKFHPAMAHGAVRWAADRHRQAAAAAAAVDAMDGVGDDAA